MPDATSPLLPTSSAPNDGHVEAGYGSISATNGSSGGIPTTSSTSVPAAPAPSLTLPPSFLRSPSLPAIVDHFSLPPHPTPSQAALPLVSLLHALYTLPTSPVNNESTLDIWNAREQAERTRAELSGVVMEGFREWVKGEGGVERVLWTGVDAGNGRSVRVVDYLLLPTCPAELSGHRLVRLSLERTWRVGLRPFFELEPPAGWARVWFWLDGFSTPRLLHAHALLLRLTFLLLTLHLALFPPLLPFPPDSDSFELRTYWTPPTTLWSIFALSTPLSRPSLPSLLALLSFLLALPSPPVPTTSAFYLLLASLTCEIFSLHLPHPPSPVFLSSPALRLSTTYLLLLTRALLPALAFFIPVALLGTVAISLSLKGEPWHPYLSSLPDPGHVSPYETRVVLLGVLICAAAAYLWIVAVLSFSPPSPPPSAPHLDAALVRAQIAYTYLPSLELPSTYALPPPLNVITLLLADLPCLALSLSRIESTQARARAWREGVRRWVWRLAVGWVVGILAGMVALGELVSRALSRLRVRERLGPAV